MAVEPTEEGGNVPAMEQAPIQDQPAETVAPTETTEPEPAPEPALYELPDGRKVDGATVAQEYKNLLSDYTRKSQALAARTENLQEKNAESPAEWVPQTYAELLEKAKEVTLRELEAKETEKARATQELEDTVASQLAEVKSADPTVNENALFVHATKYGFRDLKVAHQNMRDMSELAKKVQQATATNIAKRSDPVSSSPGATGQRPDPSQFENAREYLRSIKH